MSLRLADAAGADDVARCADIWLAASLSGHDFISPQFWVRNHAAMRDVYLPGSKLRMALKNELPIAFSACREAVLEALFVLPEHWGEGAGSLLLRDCMRERESLALRVYAKNLRALAFYEKAGFTRGREHVCTNSGETEIAMVWQR